MLEKRLMRQANHWAQLAHQGSGIFCLEAVIPLDTLLSFVLRVSGLAKRAHANYFAPRVVERRWQVRRLPRAFAGFRLLQLSDLHLDLDSDFTPALIVKLQALDYDAVVITGDFRNSTYDNHAQAVADAGTVIAAIGVGFVAIYQAGYKAAEMFGLFSVQMQDALSPAAAHMHATRNEVGLRDLLVKSTRVMLFITVPLYALCAAYLEPLIKILTGLKAIEPSTYWVGQALLLATFSLLITSSCSKRILMMCGWESALLKASLVDAGINLLASIVLVSRFGVLGVALGTMIPTLLIGWLWIVPLTARFLKISVFEMLASFVSKVWLPLTAALGVLAMILWLTPIPGNAVFMDCIWRGTVTMLALLMTGFPFLKGMRSSVSTQNPI